jgi:hypothetical protein
MVPTITGITPQINSLGKKQAVLEERPEYERCRKKCTTTNQKA